MALHYEILDDTLLVQLDTFTPEEGQLYLPKFDTFSADDGRTKTRLSDDIFTTTGTVTLLGLTYNGPLATGDKVLVSSPSAHKYHFNPSNSLTYTGLLKIPQSLIDARLK
jgi:hypothetical protein